MRNIELSSKDQKQLMQSQFNLLLKTGKYLFIPLCEAIGKVNHTCLNMVQQGYYSNLHKKV